MTANFFESAKKYASNQSLDPAQACVLVGVREGVDVIFTTVASPKRWTEIPENPKFCDFTVLPNANTALDFVTFLNRKRLAEGVTDITAVPLGGLPARPSGKAW